MINLVMRLFGLGAAVDAIDGETSKAYQGAVLLILTGLGSLFLGLGHIAALIVAAHGVTAYIEIAKQVYAGTPDTVALLGGLAAMAKGWAEIGQRHAMAKLHNAVIDAQLLPPAQKPDAQEVPQQK